ncbi:MAG TPA: 4-vinyl reductase [Chloroflexi bacterium]|nr:4-vinyl reductase [Chloroflexota bacterium]
MSDKLTPTYYYPNKMGRIILLAMEEILGKNGINAILNHTKLHHWINNYPPNNLDLSFPFSDLSNIQVGLEEIYGPRGGQGLATRIGQATFKYGLREFGPMLGITDMAFRLLPLPTKLSTGASIFAETFNRYTDQKVRIEDTPSTIFWHIERCPICWERKSDKPCCNLAVGILQEALYWISSGKFFNVQEISCIAQGDPTCTIAIDKPVE